MSIRHHRPISLTVEQFKSFKEPQTFNFPDEQGKFYFITGENQVEPALEANGVGKSSLLDALIFLLYNKTSRGVRASDIETWGERGCRVEYTFKVDEDYYSIIRTRAPIGLWMNKNNQGATVAEQSDIEQIIGLDYNSFIYSVIFSQFTPAFFDLRPTEKTELFNSLLDLDYWTKLSEKAKNRVAWYEGLLFDEISEIKSLNARIEEVGKYDYDYEEEIRGWADFQKERIEKIKKELRDKRHELEKIKGEGEDYVAKKKSLNTELEELNVVYREVVEIKNEVVETVRNLDKQRNIAQHTLKLLDSEKTKLQGVGGVCSYCKQEVDAAHIEKELAVIDQKIKENQQKIAELQKEFNAIKQDNKIVEEELDDVKQQIDDKKLELSKIEGVLIGYKRSSQKLMQQAHQLREELTDVERQENPYIGKRKKTEEYLAELQNEIEECKKEVTKGEQQIERYKFWVKGFKKLRLFVVQQVLDQLEIEVNNCLFQLGLEKWTVKFSMEQETKSQTIKHGFAVLIYSPYNETPVPWEAWSGGESQRLRIAGMLGFSNLLLARSGVEFAFEMFDEPSTWLSVKGIQDLMDVLAERARKQNKQVWIIDHRSLEFPFDNVVKIVKTLDGSEIHQ